jgi:uncharacterized protein (DUF2336 family)
MSFLTVRGRSISASRNSEAATLQLNGNMENENLCARAKSTSKASLIELCSVEHGNTWAKSSRKSSPALAAHHWQSCNAMDVAASG